MERMERPWGRMWKLFDNGKVWLKVIRVEPFQETSLQRHALRREIHICLWQFKSGWARSWNVWKYVRPHDLHRLLPGLYIEVAWGWLDENDIIREYDRYGRSTNTGRVP